MIITICIIIIIIVASNKKQPDKFPTSSQSGNHPGLQRWLPLFLV